MTKDNPYSILEEADVSPPIFYSATRFVRCLAPAPASSPATSVATSSSQANGPLPFERRWLDCCWVSAACWWCGCRDSVATAVAQLSSKQRNSGSHDHWLMAWQRGRSPALCCCCYRAACQGGLKRSWSWIDPQTAANWHEFPWVGRQKSPARSPYNNW